MNEEWGGHFRVEIDCPRKVTRGQPFEIRVKSVNVGGEAVRFTSSTFFGEGCEVEVRGKGGIRLFDGRTISTLDLREERVPAGAESVRAWKFDGTYAPDPDRFFERKTAPAGTYDVVAASGQVFPSALEIE